MARPRIISLVPSATETVYGLGAGAEIVARSHVCDFPVAARSLPALTRPHLESESSRGIHDEVRARLSEGLAIYDIDLERLRALAPTHLLVQDQCSVCALSPNDLESALTEWLGEKPELVTFAPHQLADVWRDIETIGNAIGRAAEARRLRLELSERLSGIVESVAREPAPTRPRIACIEWLDPLMIAGHWVPELVRIAGGEPILSETGGASATIDLATLLDAAPDILVLQICGFDLAATERAWNAQRDLRARLARAPSRPPRVVLTDGDAFFNRPGPRLVESAEILAEIMYGYRLDAVHAGSSFREASLE